MQLQIRQRKEKVPNARREGRKHKAYVPKGIQGVHGKQRRIHQGCTVDDRDAARLR